MGKDPLKTYSSLFQGVIIRYADVTPIILRHFAGTRKKEGIARIGACEMIP